MQNQTIFTASSWTLFVWLQFFFFFVKKKTAFNHTAVQQTAELHKKTDEALFAWIIFPHWLPHMLLIIKFLWEEFFGVVSYRYISKISCCIQRLSHPQRLLFFFFFAHSNQILLGARAFIR